MVTGRQRPANGQYMVLIYSVNTEITEHLIVDILPSKQPSLNCHVVAPKEWKLEKNVQIHQSCSIWTYSKRSLNARLLNLYYYIDIGVTLVWYHDSSARF